MKIETVIHREETFFLIKETIDTRIFLSDDNKKLIVLDRYNNILADVFCYIIGKEAMLDIENL